MAFTFFCNYEVRASFLFYLMSKPSKEQIAHDVTIAYEICSVLKSDEHIDPNEFITNYLGDYEKFLEILED